MRNGVNLSNAERLEKAGIEPAFSSAQVAVIFDRALEELVAPVIKLLTVRAQLGDLLLGKWPEAM